MAFPHTGSHGDTRVPRFGTLHEPRLPAGGRGPLPLRARSRARVSWFALCLFFGFVFACLRLVVMGGIFTDAIWAQENFDPPTRAPWSPPVKTSYIHACVFSPAFRGAAYRPQGRGPGVAQPPLREKVHRPTRPRSLVGADPDDVGAAGRLEQASLRPRL